MSYVQRRQLLQSRRRRPQIATTQNYMKTTLNDYSYYSLQGNRGAVGKQGLPGEPGAQVWTGFRFLPNSPDWPFLNRLGMAFN